MHIYRKQKMPELTFNLLSDCWACFVYVRIKWIEKVYLYLFAESSGKFEMLTKFPKVAASPESSRPPPKVAVPRKVAAIRN